jgi:hypothetical protein
MGITITDQQHLRESEKSHLNEMAKTVLKFFVSRH